jgi:hypothetical protein
MEYCCSRSIGQVEGVILKDFWMGYKNFRRSWTSCVIISLTGLETLIGTVTWLSVTIDGIWIDNLNY